jgi:hypothetical protein
MLYFALIIYKNNLIMAKQITSQQAKELCNNFDSKYAELSKLIGKDDNRSAYISLSELKDYIDYIENSGENIDGVRVYLGSYSKTENGKENLTTVFIAPTSNKIDNTSLNSLNRGVCGEPPSKKYGN